MDGSIHPIESLTLIRIKTQVSLVFSSSVLAKRIGLKFLPGTVTSCILFSCGPCFPCWVVISAGLRDADVNGSSSLHSAFTIGNLLFSLLLLAMGRGLRWRLPLFPLQPRSFSLLARCTGWQVPSQPWKDRKNSRKKNVCWEREVAAGLIPSWTALKQKQKPDNMDRKGFVTWIWGKWGGVSPNNAWVTSLGFCNGGR